MYHEEYHKSYDLASTQISRINEYIINSPNPSLITLVSGMTIRHRRFWLRTNVPFHPNRPGSYLDRKLQVNLNKLNIGCFQP